MLRQGMVLVCAMTFLAVPSATLRAQATGVPVEDNLSPNRSDRWRRDAAELFEAGRLLTVKQVREQLAHPTPTEFTLPEPTHAPLEGRAIAERARNANVRLGWYARPEGSRRWSFSLAGGYFITADGLAATCRHCVETPHGMAEAGLVAIDSQGTVRPITRILAADEELDACLLKVEGTGFTSLPLNEAVAPGDAAYCFSDPFGQNGYFSSGIVNRFYWQAGPPSEPGSWDAIQKLRMNVSTDWALGSSGSAVVDSHGNAIGHVCRIRPMALGRGGGADTQGSRRDFSGGQTVIVLHEAIPARGVMALARRVLVDTSVPVSALDVR